MRIDIKPLIKETDKTVKINVDIDSFNKGVNDSKICLNILFPEPDGEEVEFTATFVRTAKNNPTRYCVDGITREGGLYCADVNEKGEEAAHMWLEVEFDSQNSQTEKWRNLRIGQRIKISGKLATYTDKKGYVKRTIIAPVIEE